MGAEKGFFGGEQELSPSSLEEAQEIIAALKRVVVEERHARQAAEEEAAAERLRREKVEEGAKRDPLLKSMLNQEAAKQRVAERISEGKAFGIFLIDLDKFKRYNDTYGHEAGDELLLLIEELLGENLRRADDSSELARIGGDEFLLLMINLIQDGQRSSNPEQQMANVREIILRERVEAGLYEREPRARAVGVGLSVGSAIFDPRNLTSYKELKNEADRNLYKDKHRRHGGASSR